jgi:hypothetical protein
MFTSNMFQSIKEALAKSESSSGNPLYKEILKFKAGNTYVLRLLPNLKDLSKTFYHFYTHGWNSFATGQYVSGLSLQTIGQPDPIGRERYRLSKFGTEEEKEKVKTVKWAEQWYVNVYVVDDPVNPENNGKVKIFRYGTKLNKKITSAISGDDADEFGAKVFDLSSEGVNFKLKVETQGEYVAYDSSRFTSPIDLKLSKEKQQEIYNSIFDLEAINPLKTESELMEMWKTHFHCETTSEKHEEQEVVVPFKAPSAYTPEPKKTQAQIGEDDAEISDEMIAEILNSQT